MGNFSARWEFTYRKEVKMTQAEKIVKIIMPDLIRYLKLKKSGELAQKRLDKTLYPSMYCDDYDEEFEQDGGSECKYQCK